MDSPLSVSTAILFLCIMKICCFLQSNTNNDLVKCKKEYLYGQKGTISSPGFPISYPNHTSCTWYIFGKQDEVITISFDHIDIEDDILCDSPHCCNYNWLKIGPTSNSRGRRYCGQNNSNPPPFFSIGSRVWIKFHISNMAKGGRGFQLSYIISSRQTKYCGRDEFHCSDSRCILDRWRCNHYNECRDGSDEMFCKDQCSEKLLACSSGFQCYSANQHCDGKTDCSDSSDEVDCTSCRKGWVPCGPHSMHCFHPSHQTCNGILDCENGWDEKGCGECQDKIPCSSGPGCYSQQERCDGLAQCSDFSDERDCGVRNSVVSAAVMGSLICGLLLVVAVGCTCRLYSLRVVERRLLGHRTSSTRFAPDYPDPPPSYTSSVVGCGPGSQADSWQNHATQASAVGSSGGSARREQQPPARQSEGEATPGPTISLPSCQIGNANRHDSKNYGRCPNSQNPVWSTEEPDLDSSMGDRQLLVNERF